MSRASLESRLQGYWKKSNASVYGSFYFHDYSRDPAFLWPVSQLPAIKQPQPTHIETAIRDIQEESYFGQITEGIGISQLKNRKREPGDPSPQEDRLVAAPFMGAEQLTPEERRKYLQLTAQEEAAEIKRRHDQREIDAIHSGSCEVRIIVDKNNLIWASTGDSGVLRIIVNHKTQDVTIVWVNDPYRHCAENRQEAARVRKAGGYFDTEGYVCGKIGMTRAFGDLAVTGVIAEPDTGILELKPGNSHEEEYILVTSDGTDKLFDRFTADKSKLVYEIFNPQNELAIEQKVTLLMLLAASFGSVDDISGALIAKKWLLNQKSPWALSTKDGHNGSDVCNQLQRSQMRSLQNNLMRYQLLHQPEEFAKALHAAEYKPHELRAVLEVTQQSDQLLINAWRRSVTVSPLDQLEVKVSDPKVTVPDFLKGILGLLKADFEFYPVTKKQLRGLCRHLQRMDGSDSKQSTSSKSDFETILAKLEATHLASLILAAPNGDGFICCTTPSAYKKIQEASALPFEMDQYTALVRMIDTEILLTEKTKKRSPITLFDKSEERDAIVKQLEKIKKKLYDFCRESNFDYKICLANFKSHLQTLQTEFKKPLPADQSAEKVKKYHALKQMVPFLDGLAKLADRLIEHLDSSSPRSR